MTAPHVSPSASATVGAAPAGTAPGRSGASRPGRRLALLPSAPRGSQPGYSRFVSLMKLVLPSVALILVALVVAWPYVAPKDSHFRIGFAAVQEVVDGEPSAFNARFVGIDAENRPITITADVVHNLLPDSEAPVDLEMPKADITLQDGSWLVLTAKKGVYDWQKKSLELTDTVNLFHDTGYEFHTSQATIDVEGFAADGSEPVRGHGPFGELTAEGFRVRDKGRRIFFDGKATLILRPGTGGTGK